MQPKADEEPSFGGQQINNSCIRTSFTMPRLHQIFYDEMKALASFKSNEDACFSTCQKPVGAAYDEIDGMQTLTEWLWNAVEQDRLKVLSTSFIQGLKNGTLDPIKFGVFNFQDVVYCLKTVDALVIAAEKASGEVKKFLEKSISSYKEYSSSLIKLWKVASPDSVTLEDSLARYIRFHYKVASDMEPIYMALSLIPCARLWPWIGTQINSYADTFGVYKDWIGNNLVGDDYKQIEKFLNQHESLIERKTALMVYQKCMHGELAFFQHP